MKRTSFKTENSIGHIIVPDDFKGDVTTLLANVEQSGEDEPPLKPLGFGKPKELVTEPPVQPVDEPPLKVPSLSRRITTNK